MIILILDYYHLSDIYFFWDIFSAKKQFSIRIASHFHQESSVVDNLFKFDL